MVLIRFLFLADTHLGYDPPRRPGVQRHRRGRDFLNNHHRALVILQLPAYLQSAMEMYAPSLPGMAVSMIYPQGTMPARFHAARCAALLLLVLAPLQACHLIFRYEDDPGISAGDSAPAPDHGQMEVGPGDITGLESPRPPPDIGQFLDGPPPPPDMQAPKPDTKIQPTWWKMTSNTTQNLHCVWAHSPTSVFAVGDKGTVLHYDGNASLTWKPISTLSALANKQKNLRAVHGLGSGVLVVGQENADLECTSTKCDKSRFRNLTYTNKNWSVVWCDGKSDCYAGGQSTSGTKGFLFRLNTGIWWELCSNPGSLLGDHVLGLTGAGTAGNATIYAVGAGGRAASYSFLGSGCKGMTSTGVTVTLRGAWTMPGAPLVVVGDRGTAGGTILTYGGSGWTSEGATFKVNIRGVWGSAKDRFWAVGDTGHVFHFNGSKWKQDTVPVAKDLNAIHGISGADIYVVGSGGTILRFN